MKADEYITSDTHFGHGAVLGLADRPWSSADEMDEMLIERWNAKVPKGAVVYHLGDFSFRNREQTEAIVGRLHGAIRLVRGNHDKVIKGSLAAHFEWSRDYYESKTVDGTKVVMSHYPMVTWNRAHHGAWMLHGHSHGSLADAGVRRLDIGVDTHPNYEPYSYEEVLALMQGREGPNADHHRD